jgi:enoyl-CoA hydratase
MYQNITTEQKGKILIVTVNRPDKLNALNKNTIAEIGEAINAAASDNTVGGIILTGAGTKAFVAGADISEFAAYSKKEKH